MAATQKAAAPQQLTDAQKAQIADQQNMAARSAWIHTALDVWQVIYVNTISNPGSTANVLNIPPRNVGYIKGFYIEMTAVLSNTGTVAITPTSLNLCNLLQQVVFTDLNNNVRVNTSGWHLTFLATAKKKHPWISAFAMDTSFGFGNNYTPYAVTSSIATSNSATLKFTFWVPLVYHDYDLRGGIYANTTQATMNLQLVINPAPVVVSTNDTTLAVYTGAAGAAGSFTSVTFTVYQNYLDQGPIGPSGAILPMKDLSTIYLLLNTTLVGLVVNQDYGIQYANYRDFLSTCIIFDNGGTLNAGTDINYISIQAANYTNIIKVDPWIISMWNRNQIFCDFPKGAYYLDHRYRPLNSIQYGNLQCNVNASTVNTSAILYVGFESFAVANQVTAAGSLPTGG